MTHTININEMGIPSKLFKECDFVACNKDLNLYYMTMGNNLVVFKQPMRIMATTHVKTFLGAAGMNTLIRDVINNWPGNNWSDSYIDEKWMKRLEYKGYINTQKVDVTFIVKLRFSPDYSSLIPEVEIVTVSEN